MDKQLTERPIRVLHVLDKLTPDSGVAAVVIRYLEAVNKNEVVFDILVHENPDEETKKRLQDLGSRLYIASPLKFSQLFRYLYFLHHLFKEHREYKIVHGHLPNAAIFYLGMARLMGVPVRIIHSHNTRSADSTFRRLRNSLLFSFIPLCANVCCACSEAAAQFLFKTKNGRAKSPYYLVYNAIPVQKYAFCPKTRNRVRAQLGIEKGQYVIGHVGRFCEQKNHSFLLDIFEQIHKKDPQALLMLLGDGELRDAVLNKAKRLGLKKSILYLGIRRDTSELMQAMDVFTLPSLYEGLPVVAIEAQASGLPCVLSWNITHEARLNRNLVQFKSLRSSPDSWADTLLLCRAEERRDTSNTISQGGYDIFQEASKLAAFYKSLYINQ